LQNLVDGSRILASLDHVHGVAGGLLRIAEHAIRHRQAGLALAAAEGARRLWAEADPERGVGMALRVVVKALAGMRRWRAVLATAMLRDAVAGEQQPNARAVVAYYRGRMPKEWLDAADGWTRSELASEAETAIAEALEPVLEHLGILSSQLSTLSGALGVAEALALHVGEHVVVSGEVGVGEEASALLHVDSGHLGGDEAPDDEAGGYEGLYEPPEPTGDTAVPMDSDEPSSSRPSRAPADGYEGLYSLPENTDEEEAP
jgi:hypothetical protein